MSGEGTDLMYGPSYLLDKDVILVAIQYRLNILRSDNIFFCLSYGSLNFSSYRLGPLGFFDLGDDMISGNQGLWDQQLGNHRSQGVDRKTTVSKLLSKKMAN